MLDIAGQIFVFCQFDFLGMRLSTSNRFVHKTVHIYFPSPLRKN